MVYGLLPSFKADGMAFNRSEIVALFENNAPAKFGAFPDCRWYLRKMEYPEAASWPDKHPRSCIRHRNIRANFKAANGEVESEENTYFEKAPNWESIIQPI
jgi:hypothetical protein